MRERPNSELVTKEIQFKPDDVVREVLELAQSEVLSLHSNF